MWIALIALIEFLRIWLELSMFRSRGMFNGWFGAIVFLIIDWLFFHVVLEVVDNYFHIFPWDYWRKDTRIGNFLRNRVKLSFRNLDPESTPEPAVFACHSHGVIATPLLLAFMMYPKDTAEYASPAANVISTVSSQLWMLPLTSVVCRFLAARPVTQFAAYVESGASVAIAPGGTREMLLGSNDTAEVTHVVRRRGFLDVCHAQRRAVVPILTIGNYSMYDIVQNYGIEMLQWFFAYTIGYAMPIVAFGQHRTIIPKESSRVQLLALPAMRAEPDETLNQFEERYYKTLEQAAREHAKVRIRLVD